MTNVTTKGLSETVPPELESMTPGGIAASQKHAGNWRRNYGLLLKYVARESTAMVPSRHRENGYNLGLWVCTQRSNWQKGALTKEYVYLLEQVPGWSWYSTRKRLPREKEPPPTAGSDEWDFVESGDRYRCDLIWTILLGWGTLRRADAVRFAIAGALRGELRPDQHYRPDGRMAWLVNRAIKRGLREGKFDRPKRGYLRAVLRDVTQYCPDDWRDCLLGSRKPEPAGKDETLARAIDWAIANMGLELNAEAVEVTPPSGLMSALDVLVAKREIEIVTAGS